MWNVQERGRSKAEVLAALRTHPLASERKASVEGVTVAIPPQIPAATLDAIAALLGELPEAINGETLVVSAWSEGAVLNVNVAVEAAPVSIE